VLSVSLDRYRTRQGRADFHDCCRQTIRQTSRKQPLRSQPLLLPCQMLFILKSVGVDRCQSGDSVGFTRGVCVSL
jgi:hypothetical protein